MPNNNLAGNDFVYKWALHWVFIPKILEAYGSEPKSQEELRNHPQLWQRVWLIVSSDRIKQKQCRVSSGHGASRGISTNLSLSFGLDCIFSSLAALEACLLLSLILLSSIHFTGYIICIQ